MTGKKNVSLPCAVGSTSYIDTVKNSYYVDKCKETLRMSKKEKSEKNRKKLRNPENMGFSTFLFLKIDILGVAKK